MFTKKRLYLALKFLVSGFLIWFLFTNVDLSAVKDRLVDIKPGMLALAGLILLVQIIPAALRWKAVLDAIQSPLSFLTCARIFWIGIFFNQTLPSSVGGDAVRIFVAHRSGLSLRGAINGIMLERMVTVVALVLIVLAIQPVFQTTVTDEVGRWFLSALAVLTAVLVGGLAFLMFLDRLPESLHHWRLVRGMNYLAADTRLVFLSAFQLGRAIGWGVLGNINVSLAVYVLALSLNIDVTVLECIALFLPVVLVTTLPVSIAGWGLREGAMVTVFGFVGVSAESALALSVLVGLVGIATSLPGGLIWLLTGASRQEVEEDIETPPEADEQQSSEV